AIGNWIAFHNPRRPHQALNMKTSAEAIALAAWSAQIPLSRYTDTPRRVNNLESTLRSLVELSLRETRHRRQQLPSDWPLRHGNWATGRGGSRATGAGHRRTPRGRCPDRADADPGRTNAALMMIGEEAAALIMRD
ncbi:hypothetical protein, partial [Cereibacter sediminicola]|uniref:hypothetical protein n=1 Tax=Cereibacter sediminicola TaxID=2584941 RepID=UPI003CCC8B09